MYAMNMLSLAINAVTVQYGARLVLKHISLTLQHGEILVVCGHNGSGKSTLLRVLCGLQLPTEGTVQYMWGNDSYSPRQAHHMFGWVSPDLTLYRELTARENLHFFAAMRGGDTTDSTTHHAHIDALLASVGLEGRGDDSVASYSSGMVQRLRYAYALLHSPPVLLLDEPTVTLDDRGTDVVHTLIEKQRQIGIVVIATNDQRELAFGDYILRLSAA